MKLTQLLKKITLLPWLEVSATDGDKWIGTREGDDRITTLDGNTKPLDHDYLVHAANVLPDLLRSIESAIEALYNVPEVGKKYDQQHSDTHLAAVVELKAVLAKVENISLRNPIASHDLRSFSVQTASTAPFLTERTPVDHGLFGARI
jgi:hypothetical protein